MYLSRKPDMPRRRKRSCLGDSFDDLLKNEAV